MKKKNPKTKQQHLSILVLVHTATSATASTWGTSNNFSTKEFFWCPHLDKNTKQEHVSACSIYARSGPKLPTGHL